MLPKVIGSLSIPDLPTMPEFQIVSKVMPYIRHWPEREISELMLSPHEHVKFLTFAGPLESLALDSERPLPTALHAWGNQIYPCGCGCRSGLSEERLRSRGLHGVVIPGKNMLEHNGFRFPECRHLHPAEVLLLCGGRPDLQFDSMRLGLAAVGQLASPIQSLWIMAHIRQAIAIFAGESAPDPHQTLIDYQTSLLQVRDQMWPTPVESPLVPTRTEPLVSGQEGVWVDIVRDGLDGPHCIRSAFSFGQTIQQACAAEAALAQVDLSSVRATTMQGDALDFQRPLTSGEVIRIVFADTTALSSVHETHPPVELPVVAATDSGNVGDPVGPSGGSESGSEVGKLDKLCEVPKDGLLKLLIPTVATVDSLQGLRSSFLTGDSRRCLLNTQEDLWADDQILFHLQELAAQSSVDQHVQVWDPLAITSLYRTPHSRIVSSWALDLPPHTTIITAVLANHHWVPVVWRWAEGVLDGFSYGIAEGLKQPFENLHHGLCKTLGCPFTCLNMVASVFSSHCGAVAIAYIGHLLLATPMITLDSMHTFHDDSVRVFVRSLGSQCSRPWIWGRGTWDSSHESALIALLRQHGVPANEATARAAMVVQTIGQDKVIHALKQAVPWKELKWHANQCVPMFKLIRPSELQQAIASRAQSSQSVGTKRMKQKGKGKGQQHPQIEPGSIRIAEGTFVTADSVAVGQIAVAQIGPLQEGVVLASLDQALPYISQNRQVSLGGLAIIVLNMPDTPPGLPMLAEVVTFPAVCAANSEPLIVTGSLFQIGAKAISRATGSNLLDLRCIPTSVLKISIFRDVLGMPWEEFCQRPVHHLLSLLPLLSPCREEGCTTSPLA